VSARRRNLEEFIGDWLVDNFIEHLTKLYADRLLTKTRLVHGRIGFCGAAPFVQSFNCFAPLPATPP